MACVAVTSLMRTIELEFLQSNPRLILQDKQLIMSLYEKLGSLQIFLDESEKKAEICEELNDLISKIREIASKAEYDIEEDVVEIRHETLDQTLRRVVQDVEQLMESALHLAKDLRTQHLESPSFGTQSSSQHTSNNFEEMKMVGQAKELEEFKGQLLQHSDKERQVIALIGMGGIGKTTFARRIYDDPAVKSHFDCCGWATMSQDHNKRQVLLQLCRSVMPLQDNINTKDDGELAEQLRKCLLGQRYLIIVDDIWTQDAWDDVNICFPEEDENTGSHILLTTRLKEVADYACSGKLSHDMRFLDSDESWNLFCQKLLVKEPLNEEFETIGRNIVQKCHGLPLTVVVLAGHLSTNMAIYEWKNVESMLNSLLNLDLSKQFSRILTLSYNNLPCHLKSCFLYLGAFPEDFEIEIKKVIRLWIAEGFIKEVSEKTVEELGEVYLHELVNRSLIMISGRSSDGKIKTCRMHDLLHDLCVSKATTEKLLYNKRYIELGQIGISVDDNRWLSLEAREELYYTFSVNLHKCRSFLSFEMYTYPVCHDSLEVISFKMLRVLDLGVIAYSKRRIPHDIMDIILLRYLALPSNRLLTSIPVRKNKNLQTLVVREDINGNQDLPHGIWDLPQLRHFEFHHRLSIYNPEVVQLNLQTMYWLQSFQCTKQVFFMIPNVKELGIIAKGMRHHCCLENLNCLNQLEKLKVQGTYCGIELPRHAYAFPQNLKNITFSKTLMSWETMSIISMLPNLEVLKLKNHACLGQEWELNQEDGFRRLKLLLISVTDLKHWKAGDDGGNPFPVLEQMFLKNCFKLKEMPSWIERIEMLKRIQLEHCYASLVSSAKEIEEEQRENYGEEYGFQIFELYTQSDEDEKNSEREDNEDEKNSDAPSLWIDARSLYIAWVDNPGYWTWIRDSEQEVAELLIVCWLDIVGTVDTRSLLRMTCYSAYLVFKLTADAYGHDTALTSVKYIKDKKSDSNENQRRQVFLAKTRSSGDYGLFPDCRHDGWMEIKLGNFYVSSGNEGEVKMRLRKVDNTSWKGGLIVKGIEVRPN